MFTRLQTRCRLLTAQLTDLLAAACSGGAFRNIRYRLPTWERTLELYAAHFLDQVLTGLTMVCLCQLLKYHSGHSRLLHSRALEYDFAEFRKPVSPTLPCERRQCHKSDNLDVKATLSLCHWDHSLSAETALLKKLSPGRSCSMIARQRLISVRTQ